MKSLFFPEMDLRVNNIANVTDGTCEWLVTNLSYLEWLQARSGLLWIKGKPGAGKSTLMKYALRQEGHDQTIIASFFFNARGSQLERTPLGLYRSILHQLLRFAPYQLCRLAKIYKERCETRGEVKKEWEWHEGELKDQLLDLLLTLAVRPVRLYVDALDESGEAVAVQLVEQFQGLAAKASCAGYSLGVCFSCRHYPIIALDDFTICVETENSADIQAYVYQRLRANSLEERKAKLLAVEVLERANGVFQWITLVLPEVIRECRRGKRIEVVQSHIRRLPIKLHDLYGTILAGISDDERLESLKLMRWICFALRPLSLREMRHAMVVDPDTSYITLRECLDTESYVATDEDMRMRILDLSKGLAEIRVHEEHDFVQFVHESVKDFLVQDGLQRLEGNGLGSTIGRANLQLAWTCIRYFSMDEIVSVWKDDLDTNYPRAAAQQIVSMYPLIHYATVSWVPHTVQAGEQQALQEDLFRLLCQFHGSCEYRMRQWTQLYHDFDRWPASGPAQGMTILHIIAIHGLCYVLSIFLNLGHNTADAKDCNGRTPLAWAAARGHETVVKLLVERDDVEADSKDNGGQTPLLRAAARGYEAVVKLLVKRDDVKADLKDNDGSTPLLWAAARGHEAVVKLLVERDDVEADSKDNDGRTPLSWAAVRGHEAVVKLLVERDDVEADLKDNDGRTPLSWAADEGHEAVVKLLIERDDVEADPRDNSGRTPLLWAAARGHEAVVRLLVERDDVKADSKDRYGQTLLSWAAVRGHEAVVKLLVERDDVKADSRDNDGLTPLSWAAVRGHEAVVKLLVERDDVEANLKDNNGRTPL